MFEPRDDTQARRLCRIYLKLFEAGSTGASVSDIDATGQADLIHRRGYGDAELVRHLLDDNLFDRVGTRSGITHYALPPMMHTGMAREVSPGITMADRLREIIGQADRGQDVPGEAFSQLEREIRTGPW